MTGPLAWNVSEARSRFKDALDAAVRHIPTSVVRGDQRVSLVDSQRLRRWLTMTVPAGAEAVAENDGWSLLLPIPPIATDGTTLREAVDDMIAALREYAQDWINDERLQVAINHRDNDALVALIALSTDDELRDWLLAGTTR